jgi:hypothetical protein
MIPNVTQLLTERTGYKWEPKGSTSELSVLVPAKKVDEVLKRFKEEDFPFKGIDWSKPVDSVSTPGYKRIFVVGKENFLTGLKQKLKSEDSHYRLPPSKIRENEDKLAAERKESKSEEEQLGLLDPERLIDIRPGAKDYEKVEGWKKMMAETSMTIHNFIWDKLDLKADRIHTIQSTRPPIMCKFIKRDRNIPGNYIFKLDVSPQAGRYIVMGAAKQPPKPGIICSLTEEQAEAVVKAWNIPAEPYEFHRLS